MSVCTVDKSKVEISQNFVAFSEYTNFDIFFLKSIYYFQISDGVCNACNGYYGPAHGQSVCPTCHAFLYANDLDLEVNVELASVERDGEDSDSGKKH